MPKGIYKRTYKHTDEWKQKLRERMKGNKYSLGAIHSKEWKEKAKKRLIQEWKSGKRKAGWKLSMKSRIKMSIAKGGNGNIIWGTKRYHHPQGLEYREWRTSVFKRDNYACQKCGVVKCYLQAHHIKSWAKYPELRYEITNGITLCRDCHKTIRKYNL
jgi:hypothetical protein